MGETRNAYRILVVLTLGKCPSERLRRWDNINMDLREIQWVQRMRSGWNWLRIISSGGLSSPEPSSYIATALVSIFIVTQPIQIKMFEEPL
jgi:hypothetical protein